ncbi:MAG: hypothetical protein FWD99_09875 [Oscillospiraceae bacterium]|nr:hypothetical protein [Oscillospiraceae bacterium]
MSNEDKILAMLENNDTVLKTLVEKVDQLDKKVDKLDLEMRGEMRVFRTDVTALNIRVGKISQDLDVVKLSVLTTEHDHYPRIQAALDGFATATEHNEWQDQRIQAVEETVQRHDIELFALKEAIG